jgi:DNA-binding GntR family transcriptional regulator
MYSDVPVYRQLADLLRQQILSGKIGPRQPVPSAKALVQEFGIARGTAERAVAVLRSEGLVRTVPGKGVFVVPEDERPKT